MSDQQGFYVLTLQYDHPDYQRKQVDKNGVVTSVGSIQPGQNAETVFRSALAAMQTDQGVPGDFAVLHFSVHPGTPVIPENPTSPHRTGF